MFPTQQPLYLSTGRLLVPVTMINNSMHGCKRASVLISDDDGDTFAVSAGTTIQNDTGSQWETTVWEPTFGQPPSASTSISTSISTKNNNTNSSSSSNSTTVYMFDRNNNGVWGGRPARADERLLHAKSTDGGFTWSWLQPVRVDTIVSQCKSNQTKSKLNIAPFF